MGIKIHLTSSGTLRCNAIHEPSGNTLSTDAPRDNGGLGQSFSPTDLLATALATCMMTIIELHGRRTGMPIVGITSSVIKEMVDEPRRRVARLTLGLEIAARQEISASDRAVIEDKARHCPVAESLSPAVEVLCNFVYKVIA